MRERERERERERGKEREKEKERERERKRKREKEKEREMYSCTHHFLSNPGYSRSFLPSNVHQSFSEVIVHLLLPLSLKKKGTIIL